MSNSSVKFRLLLDNSGYTCGAQTGSIAHLSDCQPTSPAQPPILLCSAQHTTQIIWLHDEQTSFFLQWQKATITNTIIAMPKFNLLRAEAGDTLTNRAMLMSDCSCLLNKMPVVAVHFSHDTGYPSTFIVYWCVVLGDCGG